MNKKFTIKEKQQKHNSLPTKTAVFFLFLLFSPIFHLTGEKLYLIPAGVSVSVPDQWNTKQSKTYITSTSQDGLASFYCAIIDPLKTKESLLNAAKVFTSEIDQFSFKENGKVEKINDLDCFKIRGSGIVNHSKILVSLAFYTTPSKDMIIVASIYSDAYGVIYKDVLFNAETSVKESPKK